MRTMRYVLVAALVAALPVGAQEKAAEKKAEAKPAAKAKGPSQDEMMRAWQAYMAVGEPHQELVKMAGSWTTTTKSWMDPSKPQPEETTGSSEVTSVLGGRYISERFTGTMMGQPFEGFGVTGYDNKLKEYQTFWIDSAGTGMMIMRGKADKAGKVITQTGTMVDPLTGKPVKLKGVTTLEDNDNHKFEMWMTGPDGKSFKTMEITYRRKK